MSVQAAVDAFVKQVDAIRLRADLNDGQKDAAIKEVEAKIREVRPQPAHHRGTGPDKTNGATKEDTIAKIKKRLADPAWAHKHDAYQQKLAELEASSSE